MKIKVYVLLLGVAIAWSSCGTKKNKGDIYVPSSGSASEVKVTRPSYMSSYTRLSDIIHTKLDVSFNWDSCFVYGKATLRVKPYFYPTDQLILDAKGFRINSVKVNGKDVQYQYDDKRKLKISLGRVYTRDENYQVFIDYVAMPNRLRVGGSPAISSDKGLYFINPQGTDKYKPRQLWSQGETEANSCWFPTIEAGNERFSQEIAITVESNMVTLSNGKLEYSTSNGNGTRTDHWKQELAHAPYLVMIAAGDFTIVKDKWRDMEVSYYMEPEYAKYARLIFGKTPEMIEFFSKKLGVDYPWDKYSQIVVRDFVSGAMENTGAVTFFDDMNMTDRDYLDNPNEDIISHELFHHWFGDMVTCESWPNLPLNESFATYGEYLWNEYKYGRDEADKGAQNDLTAYLAAARQGQVDMIRYAVKDREEMFDANSYQKGGRIIHMLRNYVGDDAFFTSLHVYLDRYKYQPVEIHHLRLVFEEVTGEDLNWFFNQWFLASGHPSLQIDYKYDMVNNKAKVLIRQNQNFETTPLYRLPLTIDIYEGGKVRRERIIAENQLDSFEFSFVTKPDLINVDAQKTLLCVKKDNHSKEEWVYMFRHAPLFLDRYEALEVMDKFRDDFDAQEVIQSSLTDPFWAIRMLGLTKVKSLSDDRKERAYPVIARIAQSDTKSSVRARAVKVLDDQFKTKESNSTVFASSAKDSSYMVVAATIKAYSNIDKPKAVLIAKENTGSRNSSVIAAIAELYSTEGSAEDHAFFLNYMERASGFGPLFIFPYYKLYIRRMDDKVIRDGVPYVRKIAENATLNFVESSAKGILGDMLATAKGEDLKAYIRQVMDEMDKNEKAKTDK